MELARTGSYRVRARNTERATKNLKEQQRRRVAARTYAALQQFEDALLTSQGAQGDVDDLPIDADSQKMRKSMMSTSWDASVAAKDLQRGRSGSVPAFDSALEKTEKDPYARRPPSPLGLYDYGVISKKPRSVFAQQQLAKDKALRPRHRQTSPGFYFPGPQFRQGPYGFSMLDPIFMASRGSHAAEAPPERWGGDAVDARPATLDALDRRKGDCPVISDEVRGNAAHERRAKAVFRCMDRRRDDMFLEKIRFENGVYEGRWRQPGRDPTLDRNAAPDEDEDEKAYIQTEWAGLPDEELSEPRRLAATILFGLETALNKNRAKLGHLFKAVGQSAPGVLEPGEFLRGLCRLGIVQSDEVSPPDIIAAMAEVDPKFNGRVEFPTLEKAIGFARQARKRLAEAEHQHRKHQHKIIAQSYSESFPVEVIKVDRDSRSLVIFQRSFEKFRKQQRDLLVQHNEQPQPL